VDLPRESVVAMRPRRSGDIVEIGVEEPLPYGPGKVTALAARTGSRRIYAAFGDNAFDLPMLAASDVPVAVRPKPRLRARAHELPELVELCLPDAVGAGGAA
jgi:phosphoserine phosphatase